MIENKPIGMRIGESVFCGGYLIFVLVSGLVFLSRLAGNSFEQEPMWTACAFMAFLLFIGDGFHLIPRIMVNIKGDVSDREEAWRFRIGLGNLISSITMTLFYIALFCAVYYYNTYRFGNDRSGGVDRYSFMLITVMSFFATIRLILCLLPQNDWFGGNGNEKWTLIRNIPFLIVGLISVFNLIGYYIYNGSLNLYLAVLIILSFVFYMIVVLRAKKKPILGLLMIPKTVCYILIICVFL